MVAKQCEYGLTTSAISSNGHSVAKLEENHINRESSRTIKGVGQSPDTVSSRFKGKVDEAE